MRRREFIAGLGGAAAWSLAARGQELPTIGWLYFTSPDAQREYRTAFYRGLAETGYIEGRNVVIDEHSGRIALSQGQRWQPIWSGDRSR
jgi:putative tryptophan/tyrosine transport system substrate-binding protein